MQDFLSHIKDAIEKDQLFRLTLSKPRTKNDQLKNIYIRPIELGNETAWQATLRYRTNDKAQNINTPNLLQVVETFLKDTFYNADLFLNTKKITLLQSKKGKATVLTSDENHTIEIKPHDHRKQRLIPASQPYLEDLGITSSNGKVFGHAQDKFKQINKFVELIFNLIKHDKSISDIYDMGSGKGYLTFALHDYLTKNLNPKLQTKGIEIREDLVQKCNAIAQKNNRAGLSFELGSIDDFQIDKTDIVIALHACDIATDMAIAKGIRAKAKYIVVAPCCHKQIRKAMRKTDSSLNSVLKYGILKERQAEMITDTIRALILESEGYEVNVFEFISSEHTGKNVMLTARKVEKRNDSALVKVADLKREFGIDYHYLEKLIL